MSDTVVSAKSLPEALSRLIRTERVRLRETDGEILLTPLAETPGISESLLGLLADCEEMALDKFLARKHADKCLDL